MKTTVTQLINSNGKAAKNQFVLNNAKCEIFQSYKTLIAKVSHKDGKITLDKNALNYSQTTSKHLFSFLGMTRKEIERDIKEGVIALVDLNK